MHNWQHKDEWRLNGKNFLIVVSRHATKSLLEFDYDDLGPNRWAVYAYIYPKHSRFSGFTDDHIYSEAASALPLHQGASLVRFHLDKNAEKTSVQVGADYNHYGDDEFSHMADKDDANEVFADAERLYEFLTEWLCTPRSKAGCPASPASRIALAATCPPR